eukprot:Em0021g910a
MENKDDTFDSILFPEDRLSAKGFKEGYAYGSKQGFDDACAAGYARGKDIGKEVGFYVGFVQLWLEMIDEGSRQHRVLATFVSKLKQFQVQGTESPDYTNQISQFRAKFKHVCALLKVQLDYPSTQPLAF